MHLQKDIMFEQNMISLTLHFIDITTYQKIFALFSIINGNSVIELLTSILQVSADILMIYL